MALLAVIPVLGAFGIWIPAAALLTLRGELGKAATLAAWGGIVDRHPHMALSGHCSPVI
jgi:predicted PurR-regulated permease PerM